MSEPVLSYNPLLNMTERFTWATSHIQTWTAEERTQLRERPSYSVDYKFHIRSEAELTILEEFYRVNQTLPVRVPMWSSPSFIVNLTEGDILIPLSPENNTGVGEPVNSIRYLLEVGTEVIIWKSPTDYEVGTIASIDEAGAYLTAPVTKSYDTYYFLVCPVGLISASSFVKSLGGRKTWSFTFTCPSVFISEYPFAGATDVFDEKALESTDFTVLSSQDSDIVSNPLGLREKVPTEGVSRRKWSVGFKANKFIPIMTLKRKLAYFRGKARSLNFPYLNLTPNATPTSVCLSEDSVSFNISSWYRCSVTVGFEENLTVPVNIIHTLSLSSDLTGTFLEAAGGTELLISNGVLYIGEDPWSDYNKTLVLDPMTGEKTGIGEFTTGSRGNNIGDGTYIWATNLNYSLYLVDLTPPGSLSEIMFTGIFSYPCVYGAYIYVLNQNIPIHDWGITQIDKLTGAVIKTYEFLDNRQHLGLIKADAGGVFELVWDSPHLRVFSLSLDLITVISLPTTWEGVTLAPGSGLALAPDYIWVTTQSNKVYRIDRVTYEIDVFSVSGLESRFLYVPYIEYLPEAGVVMMSKALENKVCVLNQQATNDSELIQDEIVLPGNTRQIAEMSATEVFVTTSAGTFKLNLEGA